ncbi:DUF423 domain-containing protein [Alteromonas lipotrueae]|uniref:DUF423 domain-containing protein n=1 Tax=Alteromonas lipotrueae TaxID=2803814 RepID=UPI0030B838D0
MNKAINNAGSVNQSLDNIQDLNKFWLCAGILLAATAVMLGAFGAHGLKAILAPSALTTFEIGVRYQMYHGLAIVALPALSAYIPPKWLNAVAALFVIGCALFSGSLYLLAVTGNGLFGPITPLGGLCLIIGWMALAIAVVKGKTSKGKSND